MRIKIIKKEEEFKNSNQLDEMIALSNTESLGAVEAKKKETALIKLTDFLEITADGVFLKQGTLKSKNFVRNLKGWAIDAEGNAWFKVVTAAGYVQTFRQAAIPTSLHAGDIWYKSDDSDKMYRAAAAGATTIAAGAWVRVDVGANPTLIDALQTTNAPAAAGADVTANNTAAAIAGQGALATLNTVAAAQIDSGAVTSVKANLALRGWTFTGAFSASDADTVAWASGTFTASDGTAYSITGANTGNMAALTYIYLDIAVSTTAFQITTTAATAVGNGKVLIAIAQNQTSRATFQVFGGSGGNNLLVDNLVANSASTNEFVSNTAQLANLVVTNAKVNDLAVSKLTAGSITSKAITLAVADGTGDAKIQAGKTDFTNTENGFILGIDDSDSDKAKFYIGDSSAYLNWNGASLLINGTFILTSPIQTYTPAAAGTATLDLSLGNDHRVTMPAGNITIALSNVTVGQKFIVSITQDGTGSRTVTWFTTIRWADGVVPTLSTTANKRDTFGFICTGTNTYDGFIIGLFI